MKPTTSSVTTVSTVAGNAQVMGIDAAGMGTVLSILSNMYSDGSLAVVREYASNALDSHVEIGNPGPILVTSPSHLNPTFTVQDFGTGLSRDEVLNVYAQYGASTKRNTDEQIGAFGIGAKSAFTVGGQFAVTAIKDGMETIALFALNDDGAPTVNILSHHETMEPNGVKVEVGVKDVQGVNRAIDRIFGTWKRGTVLVDGVEPSSVWDNLSPLADDIHLGWREDRYSDKDPWVVVMGGIPYTLPLAVSSSLTGRQHQIIRNVQNSNAKVYLTVPIGAVDITPSREELRVTPKTTTAIGNMVERFARLIGTWVSEQIESASSRIGAMIQYRNLQKKLGYIANDTLGHVTWQSKPMPNNVIDLPFAESFQLRNKRGDYYGGKVASRNKEVMISPTNEMERHLYVTDVPERRTRSVQLAAKPFLEAQEKGTGTIQVIALTRPKASYANDWFNVDDPALNKIDFDSFIKEWKPAPTPVQRNVTRYDVMGGTHATAAELSLEGKVFYSTHAEWKAMGSSTKVLLKLAIEDHPLVIFKPTQKVEVLTKRVPQATSADRAMRDYAQKLLLKMDQNDIDLVASAQFLISINSLILNFLTERKSDITNQVILKVVAQYKRARELQEGNADRLQLLRITARFLGRELEVSDRSVLNPVDWTRAHIKLPLLTSYFENRYSRSPLGDQHVIDYVNSIKIEERS